MPIYAGFAAGFLALWLETGWAAAFVIAAVAGVAMFSLGEYLFNAARSAWAKGLVSAVYALPAGLVGYQAMQTFAAKMSLDDRWQVALSLISGLAFAAIAWVRIRALYSAKSAKPPAAGAEPA